MLPQRLLQHSALIQKIAIGLCVLWSVFMLVMFWLSGAEETELAQRTGKRFIITLADGKVSGHQSVAPEVTKEAEDAALPPSEEEALDETIVQAVAVKDSTSSIPEVNPELVEKIAGVSLPRKVESMLKPWQYYMKPFRRQNELPLVAIVITGLGHSRAATEMALATDDRIGLSFSPYAQSVSSWAAASRLAGHEMYVDVPMQTTGYPADDPGPYSILTSRSNAYNIKYLQWAMSRFQGYVGLVAPMNEVVTSNMEVLQSLNEEIAKRGVMIVTQRSHAQLLPEETSRKISVVSMAADVWLDEELTEMSIQARLATLEQTAQRNGFAIGVAQAYPLTIKQIKYWQQTLGERGVMLAPVSFLTKLKH